MHSLPSAIVLLPPSANAGPGAAASASAGWLRTHARVLPACQTKGEGNVAPVSLQRRTVTLPAPSDTTTASPVSEPMRPLPFTQSPSMIEPAPLPFTVMTLAVVTAPTYWSWSRVLLWKPLSTHGLAAMTTPRSTGYVPERDTAPPPSRHALNLSALAVALDESLKPMQGLPTTPPREDVKSTAVVVQTAANRRAFSILGR